MNTKNTTDTGDVILKRSRHFIFTLNNYTEKELKYIQGLVEDQRVAKLICQEEIGEEEGTVHLQFAISYVNPRTFMAVKKEFPRAHIEVARNKWAVMNYCKKGKTSTGNHAANVTKNVNNQIVATLPKVDNTKVKEYIEKVLDNEKKEWFLKYDGYLNLQDIIKYAAIMNNSICYIKDGTDERKVLYNWLRCKKCNPEIIILEGYTNQFIKEIKAGICINTNTGTIIPFDSKKIIILAGGYYLRDN